MSLSIWMYDIAREQSRSDAVKPGLEIGQLVGWHPIVVLAVAQHLTNGLDLTPITFTATNVLFSIALFRYRLLGIGGIASACENAQSGKERGERFSDQKTQKDAAC